MTKLSEYSCGRNVCEHISNTAQIHTNPKPSPHPTQDNLLVACLALGCCCVAAEQRQQQATAAGVGEEMRQINKSLESLLSELAAIKREATGRLSQVRGKPAVSAPGGSQADSERIRQTKVSRFVLKRVAELELESMGMRDEMARLFELQRESSAATHSGDSQLGPRSAESRQEDIDFEDAQPAGGAPSTSTSLSTSMGTTSGSSSPPSSPATTTEKTTDAQEAAQIGFDLEQLKRLGEEIGKRLDQFGKEAAKNLAELMEGIKLVFREPASSGASVAPSG